MMTSSHDAPEPTITFDPDPGAGAGEPTTPNVNIYDRSAKVLFRDRPADFLQLALPSVDPARIRIKNPELNLPEKRADAVTFLDDRRAAVVEFMIEPDPRELRPWFIKTAMASAACPGRDVMLIVYYMTSGGYAALPDEYRVAWADDCEQVFRFKAIPMWRFADAIRQGRSPVLTPFLILWSPEDELAETLTFTRHRSREQADPHVAADMLSVSLTLASRRIRDKDWLFTFFREELQMIRTGTIFDEWIQEAEQKAEQRGERKGEERGERKGFEEASRHHVLDVLEARFAEVPPDVRQAVTSLSDVSLLDRLLRLAVKVLDLDQFREQLKAAGATS